MNPPDQSVRGYDRLAAPYRWLEYVAFGRRLQQARVALLSQLPPLRRAMFLGDGDGRLLQQFCRRQPQCQVTSIDQSRQMLRRQLARVERVGAAQRVRFECQNAARYEPPPGAFDLLVAPFFLDCFAESELQRLLPQWLAGLRDGGLFYFVDFTRPDRPKWRRAQADMYLAMMHQFFRWQTDLPNRELVKWDRLLDRQPLRMISTAKGLHPMLVSRLYQTY
ncbi:class I SAM-dependent methyltransferase [Stieleria sp. TO1_6]|uniref:class I SAM-dependent methyltransferase n=1 Tax=Stieleria tagensis TaxID=2956795 RepID=UPI00209AF235|nr:class I SAM-dependent methyltransferase [Stieleria tagensis]MCO8121922.1 class I SAM-dependent methyltransferase [Stieleria tagensis]